MMMEQEQQQDHAADQQFEEEGQEMEGEVRDGLVCGLFLTESLEFETMMESILDALERFRLL